MSRQILSWRSLFLVMLLVHLAPIWWFTYFPSQDGVSHVYEARLLTQLPDHGNYQVRQYFEIQRDLPPNLLGHLLLAGLQRVFPPLVSEKILLSALIALLPLAMLWLAQGIDRRGTVFSLVGFLFAYDNLLHMGFYNFALSLSLSLFTLGYWWRHKERMGVAQVAVLYLLLALTYLAHFFGFSALLLTMTTVAALAWALRTGRAIGPLIRDKARPAEWVRGIGPATRDGLLFLGYMLPAYGMAASYYVRSLRPDTDRFWPLASLKHIFFDTLTLATYTDWHLHLSPFLLTLMLLAAVLTLIYRVDRRQWIIERDALLIACGVLVWLFFRLPWWKNDGGWVNDRLYLFAFLLAALWFTHFPRWLHALFATCLVVLSLVHLGRLCLEYSRLQPELEEMTAAVDLVEPHSTVQADLAGGSRSDAFPDLLKYANPFLSQPYFYAMGQDVAYFGLYHTSYPYFLIRATGAPRQDSDYVLAWREAIGSDPVERYRDDYDLIHESARLKLFHRKQRPPELRAWSKTEGGRLVLRLRMGQAPPDPASAFAPLSRDARYASGGFGWVRTMPAKEWRGAVDLPEAHRDSVGDAKDKTLRIDLPDGRYDLTCHFAPLAEGSYEVNLIANDQPGIRHLVVNQGDRETSRALPVEVSRGRMTLVFYTTWDRSMDPKRLPVWALSGLTVQQRERGEASLRLRTSR